MSTEPPIQPLPSLTLTSGDNPTPSAPTAPGPPGASPTAPAFASGSNLLSPGAASNQSQSRQGIPAPIRMWSPLEHQVAGHAGVMEDESGDLVIKPALPREVAFYHMVRESSRSSPLYALKPFLPKFYGALSYFGIEDANGQPVRDMNSGNNDDSIVLENLAATFMHPSVMDVKLGTVLYGPDATPEKKARMEKKAKESTIGSKGMRMTGCKTWHAPSQSSIQTPRSFGYDMTDERLPEALVRYFPLPTDELPFLTDDDEEKKKHANREPFKSHAMPARLTYRVLVLLDENLAQLEKVLSQLEIRAVGASILVVYEGDPLRLATAFENYDANRVSRAVKTLADDEPHHHALGDEINPDTDDDEDDEEEEDDYDDDLDPDDLDGVKADARRLAKAPPLTFRLIDFAHTWLAQDEGPDKGVLLGIETVRALVKRRMNEVKAWMDKHEPESPSKVSAGFGSSGGEGASLA